jgi:transcriptional regulator with XRE-family HTH domain
MYHKTDVHIGRRLRERRVSLGMSQSELAEKLGVSFQQVQKYERGTNRVSASRLFDLSRVLDTDMNFFFEDMPAEVAARSPSRLRGVAETAADYRPGPDPANRRETLELVRAYYRIRPPELRRRLFEMTKALSALEKSEEVT